MSKRILYSAVLSVLLGVRAHADSTLSLTKGTPVKIHIGQTLSSETARLGETIRFEVLEDVKVGDVVVIPKGAEAEGFVVDSMPARHWGLGRLSVYVNAVHTRTGYRVPVYAVANAAHTGPQAMITPEMDFLAKTSVDLSLDRESYVRNQ